MDYDEDGASILWEWEGLWGASTSLLDATDRSSALFTAPAGSAGEEYHYIASMTSQASGVPRMARRRVIVTVAVAAAEEEGTQAAADASALAVKGNVPVLTCANSEAPEGGRDIKLNCRVANEPADATYSWAPRGGTTDTDDLSSTTILKPTFNVPMEIGSGSKDYKYTVTLSASAIHNVTEDVRVRVWHRTATAVTCTDNPYEVEEGADDITLSCTASLLGPPWGPLSGWEWSWRSTGRLTNTDSGTPTFDVPDDVDRNTTWTYTVLAGPDPLLFSLIPPCFCISFRRTTVTVTVRDTGPPAPVITCNDSKVYEDAADFELDCSVENEPTGATYSWAGRGSTTDTSLLTSGADGPTPTFAVPDALDETTTYEYLLTVSAENAEDAKAEVTVTVLNRGALALVCTDPGSVYEGSEDVLFDCSASGAPGSNPGYTYAWTTRGDTPQGLLSGVDIASPTFYVPDALDETTTYEYLLTVARGECGGRYGRGDRDGFEPGCACARVRGSGFGVRRLGRLRVRLLGIRCAGV